jgi:hypothetical protein
MGYGPLPREITDNQAQCLEQPPRNLWIPRCSGKVIRIE